MAQALSRLLFVDWSASNDSLAPNPISTKRASIESLFVGVLSSNWSCGCGACWCFDVFCTVENRWSNEFPKCDTLAHSHFHIYIHIFTYTIIPDHNWHIYKFIALQVHAPVIMSFFLDSHFSYTWYIQCINFVCKKILSWLKTLFLVCYHAPPLPKQKQQQSVYLELSLLKHSIFVQYIRTSTQCQLGHHWLQSCLHLPPLPLW